MTLCGNVSGVLFSAALLQPLATFTKVCSAGQRGATGGNECRKFCSAVLKMLGFFLVLLFLPQQPFSCVNCTCVAVISNLTPE